MGLGLGGAVVAILASSLPAAGQPAPCVDGRFEIRSRVGPSRVVAIDAGQVSIEDVCPPAPALVRPSPRGTALRVTWPSCAQPFGETRLRATLGRSCTRMTGVIRRAGAGRRRFVETRIAVCGNGVRACDDGNTADGDCCSALCQLEPRCDGSCGTNDDCAPGAYCAKRGGCGGTGRCAARPEACVQIYDPVCGCDGGTYSNACAAAAAGVNVARRGACNQRCGTIAGIPCPDGEFCEFAAGECQGADLDGTCVAASEACPRIFDPVCGCDGTTYPNDCVRRAAGVQKDHDGACAD